MNELISICIPSYKRPQLLSEAISSCFANNYRPLEILVGDDSPDDKGERVISGIQPPDGIRIHYRNNTPRLGQPKNVNALFDAANGARVVLLHDDDRLLPNAIDKLNAIWSQHENLVAVFGKPRIIDMAGRPLREITQRTSVSHFRTKEYEGIQKSSITSALTGRFWYGYMIRTSVARSVRYSEYCFRGDGSDFDFSVRLALATRELKFYYVDDYVIEYRSTDIAISTVSLSASYAVQLLSSISVPEEDRPALESAFRWFAPGAIPQLVRRGLRRDALTLYLSGHYPIRRLSLKGAYHIAAILLPGLAETRERLRTHVKVRRIRRQVAYT